MRARLCQLIAVNLFVLLLSGCHSSSDRATTIIKAIPSAPADKQSELLFELGDLGPKAVPTAATFAKSPDFGGRAVLLRFLAMCPSPDTEDAINKCLLAPDLETRVAAIHAAGKLKLQSAWNLLLTLTQGKEYRERAASLSSLSKIDPDKARPILLAAASAKDSRTRVQSLKLLSDMGFDQKVVELARPLLQSSESNLRYGAFIVLGRLTPNDPLVRKFLKAIGKQLAVADSENKTRFLYVIGLVRHPESEALAISCLSDANEEVRLSAWGVLAALPKTRTRNNAIIRCLLDPSWQVQFAASQLIERERIVEAVPTLTAMLRHGSGPQFRMAISTLGRIGDPKSRQEFERLLQDGDQAVRFAAAIGLSRIGLSNSYYPKVTEELSSMSQSLDWHVRLDAYMTLQEMFGDWPRGLVSQLKVDPNPYVREVGSQ